MRELLLEARNEIQRQYMAAGGDEEARTNPGLAKMGNLIDRMDIALSHHPDRELLYTQDEFIRAQTLAYRAGAAGRGKL